MIFTLRHLFIFFAYLTVLGAFGVVEWIGLVFPWLSLPWFGQSFPYFAPMACIFWYANKRLAARENGWYIRLRTQDLLFAAMLTAWLTMEFYHAIVNGMELRLWFVLPYVWMYFFYLVTRSFDGLVDFRKTLAQATVIGALVLAVTQLAMEWYLHDSLQRDVRLVNLSQLRHNNSISYIGLFALTVLLFENERCKKDFRQSILWVVGVLFVILMLAEGTRGAWVPAIIVFTLWLVQQWRKGSYAPAIVASITVFAISTYFWSDIEAAWTRTLLGLGFESMSRLDSETLYGGDQASAYIRYRTLLLTVSHWLEHPWTGIGIGGVESIKVFGYSTESGLIIPVAAYGAVGLVSYVAFWGYAVVTGTRHLGIQGLAYSAVAIIPLLFVSGVNWWYGLLLYFLFDRSRLVAEKNTVHLVYTGSGRLST